MDAARAKGSHDASTEFPLPRYRDIRNGRMFIFNVREKYMRKLLSTLIAVAFAVVSATAAAQATPATPAQPASPAAQDQPKADKPKAAKKSKKTTKKSGAKKTQAKKTKKSDTPK